jgi:hypothetical protein
MRFLSVLFYERRQDFGRGQMGGTVSVNGHDRFTVRPDAYLGQATAFLAPAMFQAKTFLLGIAFSHNHPTMGFTVDAD